MVDLKQKPFCLSEEEINWVEETIAGMSLDEKIGQLICLNILEGDEDDVERMFADFQPGAVMYRPMELEQELKLTERIGEKAKIPLLIAANLERGGVGICTEGTMVGTNLSVAATDRVENAARLGEICAQEGKAVGANWAFAPVIDICYNTMNPITNVRTFGSDPDRVAAMGKAYVKAVQERGMAASIKHFPGDGVDYRDQHLVTSVNTLSAEEWDKTYGMIYRECIQAGALTCMVGHIAQPACVRKFNPEIEDKDIMPASLSREMMTDLLRGELGFNGMIVTDATTMAGFCIPMKRELAVPHSIACGADMFLFTQNTEEDFSFMKQGVLNGTITEERLHDALRRILATKAALKLNATGQVIPERERSQKEMGNPLHQRWAREIADQAITLVKEEKGVLPLSVEKSGRILYIPLQNRTDPLKPSETDYLEMLKKKLEERGYRITVFAPQTSSEGKLKPTREFVDQYDLILYAADYQNRSSQTTVRLEWDRPRGTNCPNYLTAVPTIFISLENPFHLQDVPRIRTYINTYCKNEHVVDALIEKLEGRSAFQGISPIDPFCGLWDARL